MSLIDELKRRNVFKVGAAYLALAWVVVQATDAIVPALNLPATLVPIVVWIGIIGFPCVIIFSWAYELTPEGLKRESEVDRTQSITHVTGKRLDYIIIALLVVAIGLFVLQYLRPPVTNTTAEAPATAATPAADSAAAPAPVQPVTPAPDEKSIAVLPFADMSQAKDQEYFSDGISEELLNLLAKIPELKVIARTSSFAFKGEKMEIDEIARRLNVAHVLEGSVRKSGNQVRITAQLIRTADSTHLWSETWDRPLDNIFAVQDEIAAAVVGQLKLKLLAAAPKAKEADPEAYALFLQARALYRQSTPEGFEQAIALAQQALARDSTMAAAWDLLSSAYSRQVDAGLRPSAEEGYALAREAAEKALALDPGYAPAHASLGWIAMTHDGDLAQAARHLEQALALAPGDTDVLNAASVLAQSLGRLEQAIAIQEYVVARDPVNASGHSNLGNSYRLAQRPDASLASLRRALQLAPGMINVQYLIGSLLLAQGQGEAALTEMQKEPSEPWRLVGLTTVYHALGRQAESDAALAELIDKYANGAAYNIAYVLADRGDADRAFEWLDKAVANKDGGLSEIVTEPLFAKIHDDPRWLPFLRKLGKTPEQLAAIKFEVTLPR